jgi:hypothetical protein
MSSNLQKIKFLNFSSNGFGMDNDTVKKVLIRLILEVLANEIVWISIKSTETESVKLN